MLGQAQNEAQVLHLLIFIVASTRVLTTPKFLGARLCLIQISLHIWVMGHFWRHNSYWLIPGSGCLIALVSRSINSINNYLNNQALIKIYLATIKFELHYQVSFFMLWCWLQNQRFSRANIKEHFDFHHSKFFIKESPAKKASLFENHFYNLGFFYDTTNALQKPDHFR